MTKDSKNKRTREKQKENIYENYTESNDKYFYVESVPGKISQVNNELGKALKDLEKHLNQPLFLLIQAGSGNFSQIKDELVNLFLEMKYSIPKNVKVSLLLDSPGGQAESAYRLAKFLKQHCGGYRIIIPRYAKSAATLLTLGADEIILGSTGELGPLDVQIMDPEREHIISALDEVQALERLHAFTLSGLDMTMVILSQRSHLKQDILLSLALEFMCGFTQPLLEKIDAVHYTEMSRILKIGEEYAIRLLRWNYPSIKETGQYPGSAEGIAHSLVESYPEHGFVIDADEAIHKLGLKIKNPDDKMESLFDIIRKYLGKNNYIGIIKEGHKNEKK